MQPTDPTRFPIPLFLWQSLEASLKHESRRLVREIASTLKTNEADLWKQVNKEVFSAYLVDMAEPTNEQFECCSYELCGPIYKPCRKPVVFGKKTCPDHTHRCLTKPPSGLPKYRVLSYLDDNTDEVVRLYLDPATNEVFAQDTLEKVGTWSTEEKSLTLYVKEE